MKVRIYNIYDTFVERFNMSVKIGTYKTPRISKGFEVEYHNS